jgi:hypothetical protein
MVRMIKSRRMRWMGNITCMREMRYYCNFQMDLREKLWECMDWVNLGQDREQMEVTVNIVVNLLDLLIR